MQHEDRDADKAHRDDFAMRHIDHPHHPESDGKADGCEEIDRRQRQRVKGEVHRHHQPDAAVDLVEAEAEAEATVALQTHVFYDEDTRTDSQITSTARRSERRQALPKRRLSKADRHGQRQKAVEHADLVKRMRKARPPSQVRSAVGR